MSEPSLPRRDRRVIIAALVALTALSWVYLVWMAFAMDMGSPASMSASQFLEIKPWSPGQWIMMFLMWAIMMVGMMVPSMMPMTLIYAQVARKAAGQGTVLAPTAVFVSGYLVIWTLFSAASTVAQWGLDQAALLSPMMVASSPALGAALLIAAGIYQMTPYKDACLKHCRSPVHFIADHWHAGTAGAFRMGLEHGAFCLGCCWALMLLLFVGGVMSLLWIAGITIFVLLEKVLPVGAKGGRWAGAAMIAAGALVLVRV